MSGIKSWGKGGLNEGSGVNFNKVRMIYVLEQPRWAARDGYSKSRGFVDERQMKIRCTAGPTVTGRAVERRGVLLILWDSHQTRCSSYTSAPKTNSLYAQRRGTGTDYAS